jgi:hypothetical protein
VKLDQRVREKNGLSGNPRLSTLPPIGSNNLFKSGWAGGPGRPKGSRTRGRLPYFIQVHDQLGTVGLALHSGTQIAQALHFTVPSPLVSLHGSHCRKSIRKAGSLGYCTSAGFRSSRPQPPNGIVPCEVADCEIGFGKPPGVEAPIVPARPVVLSAVAPSGTLPPEKAGAAPNVDVSPRGPAPAEGIAPQPESVGSTEDAISLVEVAMVPLPANIEPVPSVSTAGFGPAPGQVGLGGSDRSEMG